MQSNPLYHLTALERQADARQRPGPGAVAESMPAVELTAGPFWRIARPVRRVLARL
jgi:hypothetical protein